MIIQGTQLNEDEFLSEQNKNINLLSLKGLNIICFFIHFFFVKHYFYIKTN